MFYHTLCYVILVFVFLSRKTTHVKIIVASLSTVLVDDPSGAVRVNHRSLQRAPFEKGRPEPVNDLLLPMLVLDYANQLARTYGNLERFELRCQAAG